MISGFDERLIALIEGHPSITIGTCDRALVPTMSRAFGARVIARGEALDVLLSHWPGPRTRENLAANGRIAMTFTAPETFDAYQVKGRVTDIGDCTAEDLALAQTYTETIRDRIRNLAEPEAVVLSCFTAQGLSRLRVRPEAVFLQTPGRNAGQKL
jgi:hypothetical protein